MAVKTDIIAPGERIADVAQRHQGVSVQDIIDANPDNVSIVAEGPNRGNYYFEANTTLRIPNATAGGVGIQGRNIESYRDMVREEPFASPVHARNLHFDRLNRLIGTTIPVVGERNGEWIMVQARMTRTHYLYGSVTVEIERGATGQVIRDLDHERRSAWSNDPTGFSTIGEERVLEGGTYVFPLDAFGRIDSSYRPDIR